MTTRLFRLDWVLIPILPDYWGVLPQAPVLKAPYFEFSDHPMLYGDRLFDKAGNYRISVSASKELNGVSVWNAEQGLDYNPNTPFSGIGLDLPKGFYWLTARVYSAATGDYLYQRRYQVDIERRARPFAGKSSSSTVLEITTDHKNGVFAPATSPNFSVRIPADVKMPAVLEYTIIDFEQKEVVSKTPVEVAATGQLPLVIPGTLLKPGEVYTLQARLKAQDKLLDEASIRFGIRPPEEVAVPARANTPHPANPPGPLHATMIAFWEPRGFGGTHYPFSSFEELVELARKKGFSCFNISLDWSSIEPLPGVYRFELLDRMVATIEKAGMKVGIEGQTFGIAPEWARSWSHLSNLEGEVHNLWVGNARLLFSPADPRYLAALHKIWHRLAQHYASDPNVIGYTFAGLYFDHFFVSKNVGPGLESRKAFRLYLKKSGMSMKTLNRDWQTQYRSWNDVDLPQPATDTHQPDLRPQWIAYVNFGNTIFKDYVSTVFDAIHSVTPDSWIQMYWMGGARNESVFNYLKSHGGFMADGENEAENSFIGTSSITWARDMPEIQESVLQMPRNRYNIDMTFVRLLYGGKGAYFRALWNMTTARDASLRAEWLDCIDYMAEKWKPVFETLKPARSLPLEIGVLDSIGGTFNTYIKSYEACQMKAPYGLTAAFTATHLVPAWFDEFAPDSVLDPIKLLIVNWTAMVLPRDRIKSVVRWVNNGGHLVIAPCSGRWSTETPKEDFVLLHELGVELTPTGKRLKDLAIQNADRSIFSSGSEIQLSPFGLDGYAGFDELVPKGREFKTLAAFSDNSPAIVQFQVGKGEVVLFLQPVLWPAHPMGELCDRGMLEDLAHWAGISRFFTCDQPEFRMGLLENGPKRYLLVHRNATGTSFDSPTDFNLSQPKLSGTVKLLALNASSYRVKDITHPEVQEGMFSGTQLSGEGIPITDMVLGETRVIELTPR